MSVNVFFDWPTAVLAGKAGHLVRRTGWTDRWLQYYNGLWWLRPGTNTPYVVKAADFGRDEFQASDWTNLPPECVQAAQTATGQTCPKPFVPDDPGVPENPTDGTGSGGATDVPGDHPTTGEPGTPPSGGGGGGGGGSGGGSGNGSGGRPPRSSVQWPSISITMDDWTNPQPCYPPDGTITKNASFGGSVTLGTTADTAAGKPAAGGYFVSVRNANRVLWSGILWPGDSMDYGIYEVGPGYPGQSSFTFDARAYLPNSNSGDITDSKSKTMQPWCEYEFQFWCDVSGGCHTGVGWVTIRDPGGTILYEGCPDQGSLGMGNTTITAGTFISIQYSNSSGPCPGGHQCDAAIFRVELAHGSARVVLGTANLNNGSDGGDRGPFEFTVTQEQLDSLNAP